MYKNNREIRRKQKKYIKRLYTALLKDPSMFSESLELLWKNIKDSAGYRSVETMWATYFAVMRKFDIQLFSENLYKGLAYKRIDPVFNLLFVERYYELLIQLALGVVYLLEQIKSKCYHEKVSNLRESISQYKEKLLEQSSTMLLDNELSDDTKWKMIRISNYFFAEVYDIVDDSARISGYSRSTTYLKELKGYDKKPSASEIYWDTFERLLDPRGYRRRKRAEAFKQFKNRWKRGR